MRFKKSGILSITAAVVTSVLISSPAHAIGEGAITVGNSVCDLATAGYGHGSATDPFTIRTPKALAEIKDCSPTTPHRLKPVLNAAGNGKTVTYTVAASGDTYGVGQAVFITGNTPSGYDNMNARVISSTPTSVTVASTETGTWVSGGTIESLHDFYKITSNISLAKSTTPWNDNRTAAITAVSGDGTTVTYTAANSFASGDVVVIKGVANNDFNLGTVTVATATSTSFTITDATNSVASSGGTASAQGWKSIEASNLDIDGMNHTISGLTIDNSANRQGLFSLLSRANVTNLKFAGASIDQTDRAFNDSGSYAGVLAGSMFAVSTDQITIAGEVISGNGYAGLLAGSTSQGNYSNVSTSGSVSSGRILVTSNADDLGSNFGGLIGQESGSSLINAHSSAKVNASASSKDGAFISYGSRVGGLIGSSGSTETRDSSASGNVTGSNYVGGAFGNQGCCGSTKNSSASGKVFAYSRDPGSPIWNIGGFFGSEGCCSSRENLTATGDIYVEATANGSGISNVGGLMGSYGCCGTITDSKASGKVTIIQNSSSDVYNIGGFIGYISNDSTVSNGQASGDVKVSIAHGTAHEIGGFAGYWGGDGALNYTHSTGNVTVLNPQANNASNIGGFAGELSADGTVMGSFETGNVTVSKGSQIGGFGGHSGGSMSVVDVYASGSVTAKYDGDAKIGGIVGKTDGRMEFTRVFASGKISAAPVTAGQSASAVGGIIGDAEGYANIQFTDSYFKGSVTGTTEVGGLVGRQGRGLSYQALRTYVAAKIVAPATSVISDPVSFGPWIDGSHTNFMDSTLAGTKKNDPGYVAKTSAQMKSAATYKKAGWTFNGKSTPWLIDAKKNGGYPRLVPAYTPPCQGQMNSASDGSGSAQNNSVVFVYASSKLKTTIMKTLKSVVKQNGVDAYYTVISGAGQIPGLSTAAVKKLAQQRGATVKSYLVELGVNKSHVTVDIKVFKIGQTPKTRILAKQLMS